MAFSENTKLIAKKKSLFRCCICFKPFVEVHHVIPQSSGGDDTLNNAAPLCSYCHDLYGGNPDKRKSIKQMRNMWWETVEKRHTNLTEKVSIDKFYEVNEDLNCHSSMLSKEIYLYHTVFEDEDFDTSVNYIYKLICDAQEKFPNQRRFLYLKIEGHLVKNNNFDHDMFELQRHFLLGFMFKFLTKLHVPLITVTNEEAQRNDLSKEIKIFDEINKDTLNHAIDTGISEIWVSDKDKMINL